MAPILQIMIGMGIGIIGALLLTPLAIGYVSNNAQERRKREKRTYFDQPGELCPICLDSLNQSNMQYMICGHALHDECFRNLKRHGLQCPQCRATVIASQ